MRIFNTEPDVKSRVKRLSNGEFEINSADYLGAEISERYVNYIKFNESSKDCIVLSSSEIKR